MTSPVETTAAMTPQAEHHDPASGSPAYGVAALAEQATGRREMSQNAVISLFGGLVIALLGALIGLMMWQFNSLGDRMDAQGARIDSLAARMDALGTELRAETDALGTELRAEIAGQGARIDSLAARMDALGTELRAEMRAGFAEINAVLLDHTDRLARLETAAGLPRPGG